MKHPPTNQKTLDTLVIGGGVAGLWTLDQLIKHGHQAALLEADALGRGQSIAAQGILHGGVKYSLSGLLAPGARQVAQMPTVWRKHLSGESEPDLSSVRVRSDHCHLWRTDSMKSILGMTGAKIALKTKPQKLAVKDRPDVLRNCPGDVALLPEQVLETPSLLAGLARQHHDHLLHGRVIEGNAMGEKNKRSWIDIETADSDRFVLHVDRLILCAGAGNETLIRQLMKEDEGYLPAMQRRPLHMSMVKGPLEVLPELNGHCVDGAATRVTITSSTASDGKRVWQLGGQLSETGCERTSEEQNEAARSCLREVLPDFDADDPRLEWSNYRIDRAEFRQSSTTENVRPDDVHVSKIQQAIVVWPTKLVLAPRAAQKVLELMPQGSGHGPALFADHPSPPVASPPWEDAEWN
jgi:hypothetical protein